MQAFRPENQKSFLQTKNGRNFSCRFLMWLGIAVGTNLKIEYAGDEEEKHIIYSSFLQLHKEESTIPRQLLAGGPPFLSRKEQLDRLADTCS